MSGHKLDAHAQARDYNNIYEVTLIAELEQTRHVASPVTFVLEDIGDNVVKQPTMTFDRRTAQSLFDALWSTGLRPSDKSDSKQLLQVTQHLNDLRELVFKKGIVP